MINPQHRQILYIDKCQLRARAQECPKSQFAIGMMFDIFVPDRQTNR